MLKFHIPLIRPTVGAEELEAVKRVFESGMLTQGPETEKFEQEFADYLKVKHAIATSSGTTALHLALICLDINQGDEVIVPDFTFPTTGNVVFHCSAQPVLCDIQLREFQIDPESIEALITEKTKTIIPVSEFGLTADMTPIMELAEKHGLHVVEDACPGLGSKRDGRFAGTFGDFGCFSFHPRKPLAIGEGGMLVTDDDELAEKARSLKNHGRVAKWAFNHAGYNYRLSDVQSAIGRVQLRKLPKRIESQRKLASTYNHYLRDYEGFLKIPYTPEGCFHTYQSYVVLINQPNIPVIRKLSMNGVETQIGTTCLHVLAPYKNCRFGNCENSFKAWKHSLTLPLYETMSWEEQHMVMDGVLRAVGAS